ncbi:MAG: hypothetical protein AAB214_09935 [Fibrobacterota bacterium]
MMKIAICAVMLTVASANALVTEIVRKWTWIHSKSSGDYLQFEWKNLPGGLEPVIDSVKAVGYQVSSGYAGTVVKVVARAWCRSVAIPEAVGAKVKIAQSMKRISLDPMIDPPLPNEYTVTLDSIDACIDGNCLGKTPVAKVENDPSGPLICITRACITEANPDTARKNLVSALASSKWAAILDASIIKTLVAPNWWTNTTGAESYSEVVAPMVSNAGNWIALDKSVLGVATAIKVGANDPSYYEIPTGKVEYVYNRVASPLNKIAIQPAARIFLDTLLKTGPELWLTGSVQRACFKLPYDSLMNENAWLVLADSAGGVSYSMQFDAMCGVRNKAWKVVGDSLWVTAKDKISLSELMRTVGVQRRIVDGAVARIALGGSFLELSEASDVRLLSADGRILSSHRLPAGRHELSSIPAGGVAFASVRSIATGAVQVLPLVR